MSGVPALGDTEFDRFRALILRVSGISLRESKRELVAGRLARRLRHHGLDNFAAYLRMLDSPKLDPDELTALVNCITTNKTDFYREPHHFDALRDDLVPRWLDRARRGGARQVRIWSAGCSTGEEPYTIAMALHDVLPAAAGWDVRILASDIDTDVLRRASAAAYPADRLDDVPSAARACFARRSDGLAIRDDVRARVEFRRVNLIAPSWPVRGPFDAIFCRNVVIYFDADTQRRLFDRFADMLAGDGRLFVGHSENLLGLSDRFVLDGQTIYRLRKPRGGTRSIRIPVVRGKAPAARATTAAAPQLEPIIVGDVRASARPAHYTTVLGSCVAACLYDPVARIGGINHFALPEPPPGTPANARHGSVAMPQLIERLVALGARRDRLQAKLFGAAAVTRHAPPIDRHNAEFVRAFLAEAGILVAVDRLGGNRPLELHFLTDRGTALFREVAAIPAEEPCHASS